MLQNVVSKANRENTPARIIAQVPILSPNCMYASSFSSAPLVPRRTVPVTTRTNTEESPKPMKMERRICFALPSRPFTTWITA